MVKCGPYLNPVEQRTQSVSSARGNVYDFIMRRQNHSCEQCRKAKKACDGYLVNSSRASFLDATARAQSGGTDSNSAILPCSYCARTKKPCSFNYLWSQPWVFPGASKRIARSSSLAGVTGTADILLSTARSVVPSLQSSSDSDATPESNYHCDVLCPSSTGDPVVHPSVTPVCFSGASADSFLSDQPACFFTGLTDHGCSSKEYHDGDYFAACGEITTLNDSAEASESIFDDLQPPTWELARNDATWTQSHVFSHPDARHGGMKKRKRRDSRDYDYHSRRSTSTDSFSNAESNLSLRSNNILITEGLLRIYNDVLENNLCCWLAESTCPYKMEQPRLRVDGINDVRPMQCAVTESIWQNRILHRVIQLDRVAQSANMIHLTRSENASVSRALNLTIMAYATQWAQGKRRHARHSWDASEFTEDLAADIEDEFADTFEQTLQQTLWERAHRALKEISDVESYRAVFAQLIFGLTNKPWCSKDYDTVDDIRARGSVSGEAGGNRTSILAQLKQLISQEGPPIVMENAARKIHTLKSRFEGYEIGYSCVSSNTDAHPGAVAMNSDNRRTIGLLYWLAVMFDTVSSSMDGRPNALCDEDCQSDEIRTRQQDTELHGAPSNLSYHWKLDYFARDVVEPKRLQWPCAYEVAADAVIRSAPVKVLLFRHVSYLQSALRRQAPFGQIEPLLQAATQTYSYWNTTFGPFFKDLVEHYDSVPPRIKGWFVCIAIPWLLGSLMLADLVEFIDKKGLRREKRDSAMLGHISASTIRKDSAAELSKMAILTKPAAVNGEQPLLQLPDSHFAVNEGTTLSEPWTMVLIRAFTKAAIFYLDTLVNATNQHEDWFLLGYQSQEVKDNSHHCQNCIEALWFLGRKAQLARNLAQVLSRAFASVSRGSSQVWADPGVEKRVDAAPSLILA
ncbi:C6 transcription factor [Pochonia chlamydosporia 170]|uniref:C6 transcription factor n=1 Tax=Pochonia chlamydosporia 170 TaxID=1380566 RepID=A0A179FHF0_METCM|nr:C6 transcription factor [Pochonia chlamydosporia 170]OAQ64964.2 C6 transcription factor [Pochonia chlamydosporia 170]